MYHDLKQRVFRANLKLVEYKLVVLTWGNASEIDRERGVFAIKPSGVGYDTMTADNIVVVSLDGKIIEGGLAPSSDTATHLEIYNSWGDVGGIVHTHSTFATAWSQTQSDIPAFGTTHADTFYGAVPCTPPLTKEEAENEYEKNTGKVIIRTFQERNIDHNAVPAVIAGNHAPFTWGRDAAKAVENALILEEVAKMAHLTLAIRRDAPQIAQHLLDKHYFRKHGKNAYYGQK